MAEFKSRLIRETQLLKISINPNYDSAFHNKRWIFRINDGINADYNCTDIGLSDVRISDYGIGSIISPFDLYVKFKGKMKNWLNPEYVGNESMWQTLQVEIDKIFSKDARKAALIIDQKSYDETPERYILGALLNSNDLCNRYGTTPLLKYGKNSEYLVELQMRSLSSLSRPCSIIEMFCDWPELDIYCTTGNQYSTGHTKYCNLSGKFEDGREKDLEAHSLNDVGEILARWGLLGKDRPTLDIK